MKRYLLAIACFLAWISTGWGLECYACSEQEDNRGKCVKTVVQCEQNEESCWSRVRWGIPPYWTPRGDRVHFVSKGCSTESQCYATKDQMMTHCKRDWYDDWACHECCSGDLCNYYATMGTSNIKANLLTALAASIGSLLLVWRQHW